MHPPPPAVLLENEGIAFVGERAWPPAHLPVRLAGKFLNAHNPCGRPNSDVLRRRLGVEAGAPKESWFIDFPSHFTEQEASLYTQPFAHLKNQGSEWKNPHLNLALRRGLARISRYLATPVAAEESDWRWIEEDVLPDASLAVVAREDDFTYGLLQSSLFRSWRQHHQTRGDPAALVMSFPFPWAPGRGLSGLTATEEEQRHDLAKAARSGNREAMERAAYAAYGWAADFDEATVVERLYRLHQQRAAR